MRHHPEDRREPREPQLREAQNREREAELRAGERDERERALEHRTGDRAEQHRAPMRGDEERWKRIQALFVDDPQASIREALKVVKGDLDGATDRLNGVERRLGAMTAGTTTTEELRHWLHTLHCLSDDLVKLRA